MLQEAVDALFDNGRRGRVLRGANNRPLKSLSDMLKGKQGRFRQNLLGKRVDYSGRSVIVVGPELKLHQCGLPKKMALELFKPFIYQQAREGRASSPPSRRPRRWSSSSVPEVWDFLEEVIREHPVLLNRAPTLHRLGIQAFEPILVEGKAIKIHPLVCTAFNADFDGDQMAVHVPLSPEAQIEAQRPDDVHPTTSCRRPTASPIAIPSQDIVLGCYYLTKEKKGDEGRGPGLRCIEDVLIALEHKEVETLTLIQLLLHRRADRPHHRLRRPGRDAHRGRRASRTRSSTPRSAGSSSTTTARGARRSSTASWQEGPAAAGAVRLPALRPRADRRSMLDAIKDLGFRYATRAGISIGIDDLVIPEGRASWSRKPRRKCIEVEKQYLDGAITNGERYNKVIAIWARVTEKVADAMFKEMEAQDKEGRASSTRSTSWPTPAPAAPSSRSASSPACAA